MTKPLNTTQIEQLKSEMLAARAQRRQLVQPALPALPTASQQAANQVLREYYSKSGLNLAQMDQLLAQSQLEQRALGVQQKVDAALHAAASKQAWQRGVEGQIAALSQFTENPPDNPTAEETTFVLQEATYILQETEFTTTYPDQFHFGKNNGNWIKFEVNTNKGVDRTTFIFGFNWTNDTPYHSLFNIYTSLAFTGNCKVSVTPEFLTGGSAYLQLGAELSIYQVWNQSFAPPAPVGTQWAFNQRASAGEYISEALNYQIENLPCNLLSVPPSASVVFEVGLVINFGFSENSDKANQNVTADFLSNDNSVVCPFVLLQRQPAPFTLHP